MPARNSAAGLRDRGESPVRASAGCGSPGPQTGGAVRPSVGVSPPSQQKTYRKDAVRLLYARGKRAASACNRSVGAGGRAYGEAAVSDRARVAGPF